MKNICIVGQHFAITAALGYFIDAAKRNKDLNVKTVGPFHGNSMPWGVVNVVSDKYVRNPDVAFPGMPIGDSYVPVEMVESMLGDFKPDIWLTVDAGFHMLGKPKTGVNCLFMTDPHTGLREIYNATKLQYDFCFNPQTQYACENEYYLPYAADPVWHKPGSEEKIYDACIIGNYYPERVLLMDLLKTKGHKTFFQLGLAQDDARLIMNQSKICINWSSRLDLTARVFETLACGTILLANRVPDLTGLFVENQEFYGFDGLDEALSKVDFILNNLDEAYLVAKRGCMMIDEGKHWWDNRLAKILEISGVCKNDV